MHPRRLLHFVLLLAFLPSVSMAADPASAPGDYAISSWSRNDGLPAGTITALAAAADGPLWVGMDSGLYTFDGLRFISADMPAVAVTVLSTTRDGSVWAAFADGRVVRLRNGETTTYGPEQGLSGDPATAVIEDADGVMWLGTRAGLYRYDGTRWIAVAPGGLPGDLRVTSAVLDARGNLLLGANNSLFRRSSGQSAFEQLASFDDLGTFGVRGACSDASDRVYVTDPVNGFTVVGRPGGPTSPVRSIGRELLCDTRGNVWIATGGGGLWRIPPAAAGPARVVTGLLGELATALAEDSRGNIWVGTPEGLRRLTPERVTQFADLGVSTAVETTLDGHVWVGTLDGLVELVPSAHGVQDRHLHIAGARVRALHRDERGTLWVATNTGILRLAGTPRTATLVTAAGPSLRQIESLASERDGTLWIADAEKGVFRLRNGVLDAVTLPFDPARNAVNALHVDATGRTWMALDRGLAVVQTDGRVQVYGPAEGVDTRRSRAILEDRRGELWFGSVDSLTRFDGQRFTVLRQADGFPIDWVKGIEEDDAGNLWFAGTASLVRIACSEFDRARTSGAPLFTARYARYDQTDGLGIPRVLGDRSAARSTDGVIWILTGNGVTRVDPRVLNDAKPAPAARIVGALGDGETFDPAPDAPFPSRMRAMRIDYTALNLDSPHRTRFRYRLLGFDDRWEDAGARLSAFYTNLPPGAYEFQVAARNEGDAWGEPGGTWRFVVQPAFYQTAWFPWAIAGLVALFAWGIWRLRLAQIQKQFTIVLGERVRLSREIHDTLLQSMVGVAMQCEVLAKQSQTNPATTKETLLRLRRQVEGHIREFRQSISDLRAERDDFLETLRAVGDTTLQTSDVTFDLVVHGKPRPSREDVERQLIKIAREAVSNAVRHAQPRSIRVDVGYDESALRVQIQDDGRGFDPDASIRGFDGHCGLISMRERAAAIGARLSIASEVGRGTLVEAVVPNAHA